MDHRDRRRVVVVAIGVAAGLLLAEALGSLWQSLRSVLSLVGTAAFLAIAMEPLVGRLAARVRRGVATGIVMGSVFAGFAGLAAVGGAVAVRQGRNLLDNLPQIAQAIDDQLLRLGISTEFAQRTQPGGSVYRWIDQIDDWAVGASGQVFVLFGQFLAVAFIAFYLSADLPRILRGACSLVAPGRQTHLVRVWQLAVEKAGGYVYSRTVLAVISTLAHAAAFLLIGVDYPIPLALWVGIVSQAVPVFGAYLAGLLPVLVALSERPGAAVTVFVVLIVYQQIENLLLAPRITADAVSVHPLTAFVSVLAGIVVFGWVGALVAVPLAGTISAFTAAFLPRHEVDGALLKDERRRRRRSDDPGPDGSDDET